MADTTEKHKAGLTASLEPVENQLGVVNKALERLEQCSAEINEQRAATEAEIHQIFHQVHQLLEARKTELIQQLDEITTEKVKYLATQKEEVETVQTQLVSCLSFVHRKPGRNEEDQRDDR